MTEDTNDFLAAFAIGALVGIGATLLLGPPAGGTQRILHEIEPALKRARKGSRRMREETRDVAREFGKRGERALNVAGDEVRRAARRKLRQARRVLREHR
jgi:gas vesicle protein